MRASFRMLSWGLAVFVVTGLAGGSAAMAQAPDAPAKDIADLKLVLIPPGQFQMGTTTYLAEGNKNEGPPHQVRISKAFLIGAHEVTQAQFQELMGRNPSHFSPQGEGKSKIAGKDTDRFPVECVSWYDALLFCNELSKREGLPPYFKLDNMTKSESKSFGKVFRYTRYDVEILGGTGYRLPTEAEWEYACRAGTKTRHSFGSVADTDQANFNGDYPYGTKEKGLNRDQPTPVGSFAPNAFGLYDMHGNVWEWCLDLEDRDAYSKRTGVTTDPVETSKVIIGSPNTSHIIRGGCWRAGGRAIGSAYRTGNHTAADYSNDTGFRVARTPE